MKVYLEKFAALCDTVLASTLIVLMFALVISVTWQVFSRYLLQAPSSWTEEFARFVLIWIGLLGAAYAYRTRAHLGLDLLAQKLPASPRAVLEVMVSLTVITFALAAMLIGGTKLVLLTLELNQRSAVLGIPMAMVYLVIPVSGLLIVFYALINSSASLADIRAAQHTQRL